MRSTPKAPQFLLKMVLSTAALLLSAAFMPSTAMATTVSMGTSHGCSVADTGVATCWGSLPMAPLAYGLRADDIRVGQDFSCALTNISVQCWGGSNAFSQLGNPILQAPWGYTLSGLRQISQIAVGARHGCARTTEQEVYCWGDASQGQIGNAVDTATTAQAVRVEGMSGIAKLAAGRASTCGVTSTPNDRKVVCVGAGSGLAGAAEDPRTPRTVPGITDALEVSLFASHACVLRAFGKVSCWGSNRYGELGVPASSSPLTSPVEVPDLGAPAKAVAVGDGFTCALLEGGTVKCWGNHANGQLGMGLAPGTATPATGRVMGITNATAISAGKTAACAALEGGYVQCWGEGAGWSSGQCRLPGGLYPGEPASWGPIFDLTICRPQGSAAPMAVQGLGPAHDAAQVLDWAEKTLPQTFPKQSATAPNPIDSYLYLREYPGGHKLAINGHGTPRLLYQGPMSAGQVADLGPLSRWVQEAALDEGLSSGLQLQAATHTNAMPSDACPILYTRYGIRGGSNILSEGLMSSSVRVTGRGQSVEHPTRSWYRKTVLTSETDWLSEDSRAPGPGMKSEPVHFGVAQGCSAFIGLKDNVDVIVFYTVGNRKGALRTQAPMMTSY